ncbi:hypothetical protein [Lysinibacter sp. HNR]|uniref:hypothetical protein n=1 Tax=Lysinibacter sp. HNR TaxID=3031408 RepID=UPI002434E583|nr:hypothetical protein [Lysinibacter sp. HNR]WGD37673.1 hypothetical protein FrondiHNR_01795 [Lysinibacter sp. HNR]
MRAAPELSAHPLLRLDDAGVQITLNSDGPSSIVAAILGMLLLPCVMLWESPQISHGASHVPRSMLRFFARKKSAVKHRA